MVERGQRAEWPGGAEAREQAELSLGKRKLEWAQMNVGQN